MSKVIDGIDTNTRTEGGDLSWVLYEFDVEEGGQSERNGFFVNVLGVVSVNLVDAKEMLVEKLSWNIQVVVIVGKEGVSRRFDVLRAVRVHAWQKVEWADKLNLSQRVVSVKRESRHFSWHENLYSAVPVRVDSNVEDSIP